MPQPTTDTLVSCPLTGQCAALDRLRRGMAALEADAAKASSRYWRLYRRTELLERLADGAATCDEQRRAELRAALLAVLTAPDLDAARAAAEEALAWDQRGSEP